MSWTLQQGNPSWNVTDQELLSRLIYMLLENGNADASPPTLITSMFTFQQLIDALNLAQQNFLRDTGCVLLRATQGTTPQISRYPLPDGVAGGGSGSADVFPPQWIYTRDITWQQQGTSGGGGGGGIPFPSKSLARVDTYQLDHGLADWQQNFDIPSMYNDGSDLPTLTIEIAKAPSEIGQLELDYVGLPGMMSGVNTLPIKLSIPDECESAVLYYALAQLFGQDGEAHDSDRAAYCIQRYQLGVDMTNLLMGGK